MFNEASAHKSATLPLLRLNRSARAISPSDGKLPSGVGMMLPCSAIVCNSKSLAIFSQSGQFAGVFHSHPTLVQSSGAGGITAED